MTGLNNAYAFVCGIANYQNIRRLPETVLKDARDIAGLLVAPNLCGYPSENVRLLLDGDATLTAIRAALADTAERTNADSTVFIYFSSHGGRIKEGANTGDYLLPVDVELDRSIATPQLVAKSAISGQQFTEAVQRISARRMVVVLDCCHSAGIGEPKDLIEPEFKTGFSDSYYEKLKAGRGRVILASSRSDEVSLILPGAKNSLFTEHLLAGLRGGAPGPGGVIRIFDLYRYVQPRVVADAPTQHPFFKAALEDDFPIALYLGGKSLVSETLAPTHDGFTYDVFLSYRQQEPDKGWVRRQLLPQLEAEGLRACVDYRDFRLGAPLLTEMERAVEQSRYTLAVLTPRYLDSDWTNLETILAQHLGQEKQQVRLVSVLREQCEPRLGVRVLRWLDMIDDSEFAINVAWLGQQLRRPPEF